MVLCNICYEVHEVHRVPNICVLSYFTFQSIHFSQSYIFLLWQLGRKASHSWSPARAADVDLEKRALCLSVYRCDELEHFTS